MTLSWCPFSPKLPRTLYWRQYVFYIVQGHLEHPYDNAMMSIHSQATQNCVLTFDHFSPVSFFIHAMTSWHLASTISLREFHKFLKIDGKNTGRMTLDPCQDCTVLARCQDVIAWIKNSQVKNIKRILTFFHPCSLHTWDVVIIRKTGVLGHIWAEWRAGYGLHSARVQEEQHILHQYRSTLLFSYLIIQWLFYHWSACAKW